MMDKIQVETHVQDWITAHWNADKSDYFNTEDLLELLHIRERQSRGKRGMDEAMLLNALYERVQLMREISLEKIAEAF